ncbi:MAG: MBOAT family O-acyltransferase, partial [Oscillospiraceae bacterium]|nr:MBOAT family O-acyltransferase [Oscillospiraceae bacterium]
MTVIVCLTAGGRAPQCGRLLLTLACLVFYIAGAGWSGFLVLAAGTAVTAVALRRLRGGEGRSRRVALVLVCCWHIAVLTAFKYTGFFTGGRVSLGWAPLGLSFFTFQQLWLLKEGYTRQYVPARGDGLILYGFFFPTVTSGPILRPGAFFPQLREGRFLRPDWTDAAAGLYALSLGLAKKTLLADSFGAVAANGWAMGEKMTAPAAWLVMLGYTLQLYFDFSGYCDMAAGAARLLGVRLPVNFDSPYRALSVGEFWKRWHITLTTFLR